MIFSDVVDTVVAGIIPNYIVAALLGFQSAADLPPRPVSQWYTHFVYHEHIVVVKVDRVKNQVTFRDSANQYVWNQRICPHLSRKIRIRQGQISSFGASPDRFEAVLQSSRPFCLY